MAQMARDDFDVDVARDEKARARMAQIVEGHLADARPMR